MTNGHGLGIDKPQKTVYRSTIMGDFDILSNEPSNQGPESDPAVRRPGRPKGLPKPLGSGRQKGTSNKVGKEARELANKHTPKAFATLAKLLDNPDARVAAIAAQQILDRRYGKPVNPTELTGRDGVPLVDTPQMSDFTLANMVLFVAAAQQRQQPQQPPAVPVSAQDPFAELREEQQREFAEARGEAVQSSPTVEALRVAQSQHEDFDRPPSVVVKMRP